MNSFVRISIVSKLLRPTVFWSRSIWRARTWCGRLHTQTHTYIIIYLYIYIAVRLRVDGHNTRPV